MICFILLWLAIQRLNLNNTLHKNVCNRSRWRSWLAISSLDAPLERSGIFTDYNERGFVSIWFISLSSNLKALYRYIYHVCESCIHWLSVHFCAVFLFKKRRHIIVFFMFIKLFYIFRALDCDQNATIFESVQVKIDVVALVLVHGLPAQSASAASRSTL